MRKNSSSADARRTQPTDSLRASALISSSASSRSSRPLPTAPIGLIRSWQIREASNSIIRSSTFTPMALLFVQPPRGRSASPVAPLALDVAPCTFPSADGPYTEFRYLKGNWARLYVWPAGAWYAGAPSGTAGLGRRPSAVGGGRTHHRQLRKRRQAVDQRRGRRIGDDRER